MIIYKPLLKLMIDRDLGKEDLRKLTGLSSSTVAKMSAGAGRQDVSMDKINLVCTALNCRIEDVIAFEYTEQDKCYLEEKVKKAKDKKLMKETS